MFILQISISFYDMFPAQPISNMFTSGYSDELLHFTVNEDTHHLLYVDSWKVESNFSFGHVSDKFSSIYFIHEVNEYEGTPNTGAVSRWKIDGEDISANEYGNNPSTKGGKKSGARITKQEVIHDIKSSSWNI